ncbi:MAG: glycosyltransferase family 4 protein [Nostoc sp.]|uniref:glycosyltransferase family 4 protein n=1 Tax=Nostoc sp. TaxID=1180 RepID=UPI002FF8F871
MLIKLAILLTHPVQYFAPVFRELAQQPNLQLKVFFGCNHGVIPREDPNFGVVFQWDCQPTAGFEHEFLSHNSLEDLKGLRGIKLAAKAFTAINHYQPDAVLIFAYSPTFITVSTLLLCLTGHKLMLRAETTDEALSRSYIKDKIRQLSLSLYYRQFTHFFPIGTDSINHYLRMGVDKSRMTLAHYAIDIQFFQKQVDFWLPQRETLRNQLGIAKTDRVLMYCGKIFPPKDPLLIPKAFTLLPVSGKNNLWLLAIGEGEMRSQFEKLSKEELGARAIFFGFKNQSELGKYYAIADALILPSKSGETWGLVVNEALQFGLKVILSDRVGSGKDLIKSRQYGELFPHRNALKLSKCILNVNNYKKKDYSLKKLDLPHPNQLAHKIYNLLNKTCISQASLPHINESIK